MAWRLPKLFHQDFSSGALHKQAEVIRARNVLPALEPVVALAPPQSKQSRRVLALLHEYEHAPESVYGERAADRAFDFLLAETALDLLPKQIVPASETTKKTVRGKAHRVPRLLRFGSQFVAIRKFLDAGGYGMVFKAAQLKNAQPVFAGDESGRVEERVAGEIKARGDLVVKFISLDLDENGSSCDLGDVAREITALARFHSLPNADKQIVDSLRSVGGRSSPDQPNPFIVGFLGASRVEVLLDSDKKAEWVAIAMERARGVDGFTFIEKEGLSNSLRDVKAIVRELMLALQPFHRRNLIHRDIKPDNFFLERGEEDDLSLQLIDMGSMTDNIYARRPDNIHETRFELAHAIDWLRQKLLAMSLDHRFDESAERAWLELSALADGIDWNVPVDVEHIDTEMARIEDTLLSQDWVNAIENDLDEQPWERRSRERRNDKDVRGTLPYMDAEARDDRATTASDLYATAVSVLVLLQIDTDRKRGRLLDVHVAEHGAYALLTIKHRELVAELGGGAEAEAFADILERMGNNRAADRFNDADDVLAALDHMDARRLALDRASSVRQQAI